VPYHPDDYVHRIGRTGRAGRSGEAYMLVAQGDSKYVEAIEKLTKTTLVRRKLEGLAEQVRDRPPREDRGGRDRDRNRGRRGKDRDRRDRPIKQHGQVASMNPATQSAPAPAQTTPVQAAPERKPQTERNPQTAYRPEPPRKAEPVHYAQSMKPRPEQQAQQSGADAKAFDTAQLPAFLLRPVKLPKAPEKKAPEKKTPRAPRKAKSETPED
jgi:superfamily II DNA/RNA helicase